MTHWFANASNQYGTASELHMPSIPQAYVMSTKGLRPYEQSIGPNALSKQWKDQQYRERVEIYINQWRRNSPEQQKIESK